MVKGNDVKNVFLFKKTPRLKLYVVKILYLCRGKREIVGENQDAGCGGAFIFLQKN